MLNKLQFNNLVISNKKKIQQVKSQTIQKLVQKLRKVKTILEKKPEDKKARERFRKQTLCLEELKKIKRVELMKKVLILEKNATSVLTNARSSPEEVGIAMLASNKIMQNILLLFREKLQLNDIDTSWKNEIMWTSKRRMKINRTELKRKRRQDQKEQKSVARKREEWLKDHSTSNNEEVSVDINLSTLGAWRIEPIGDNSPFHDKPVIADGPKLIKKNIAKLNKVKKKCLEKNTVERKLLQIKDEKLLNGQNNSIQESGLLEKPINSNGESGLVEKTNNSNEDAKSNAIEQIAHVADPFFITESGDNYQSTAVIIRDGKLIEPTTAVEKQGIWRARDVKGLRQHGQEPFRRDSRKHSQSKMESKNLEGLHPSWVAKQKQKLFITPFQGKKIKLGETETNDNKDNSSEAKHPSWEAKEKMKPTIVPFKGKKVKFDVDETVTDVTTAKNSGASVRNPNSVKKNQANLTNANSDLHPSWAAKQKFKPIIAAFEGKKIKFDDDM